MAISSKPKKVRNDVIEQIIDKGGSVPEKKIKQKKNVISVRLNVPSNMLREIDSLLADSIIPKTRHSWILEAMLEKLKQSTS